MNIEVLLTESEIAQEFADSLEARDLPEKFFYWLPLSVKAWRDVAGEGSSRELDRTWQLISSKAEEIVRDFPISVPVVSLGAGEGNKDRGFLQAVQRAGKTVKYFPVDASQTLLETACASAENEDFEVFGIKADISSPMHVILAADAAESPKVFLLGGNTLGGFDPLDQVRHIAEVMRGGDRLIIDAELFREDTEQENPEGIAKLAFAPLISIGIQEHDGSIKFETKRDQRHAGMQMITKYFQAHRDLRFTVGGTEISIARGERIFMNFRYRFTREAFLWLLQNQAKLTVFSELISSEGSFIAAVCSC